jgi:hypothetical protein
MQAASRQYRGFIQPSFPQKENVPMQKRAYISGLILLLTTCLYLSAQSPTPSTTLSSALPLSQQFVVLNSVTGITPAIDGSSANATTILFVDREELRVVALSGNTLTVQRAGDGTTQQSHNAGAPVYYGPSSQMPVGPFYDGNSISGSCQAKGNAYLPIIMTGTFGEGAGDQYTCPTAGPYANLWLQVSNSISSGMVGGPLASLPATCSVGQTFFVSNATAGQNIYECATANLWTQELNNGSLGGSPLLNALVAANNGNSINNLNYAQTWQWTLTGSNAQGLTLTEASASTGSGTALFDLATLSGSTARPFVATAGGTANGVSLSTTGLLARLGTGSISADAIDGTSVAALSGLVKLSSGTPSAAVSGTDYAPATTGTALLKALSGGFTNAVSGTDYAPATSGTSILKGNGSGAYANAVAGTDYAPVTSGSVPLKGNGAGGFTPAVATDIAALFTGCNSTTPTLEYTGTCGAGPVPGQTGSDFVLTLSTTTTLNDTATVAPGGYFSYNQVNACSFQLTAGNHVGVADFSFTTSGQVILYWTQLGTNALSQTGTTTNCAPLGMSSPYFPSDGSHWIGQLVITSSGAFDPTQIDQYPFNAGILAVTASGGLQATPSGNTLNLTPAASVLQNNQTNTAAAGMTLDMALATATRPNVKGTYASVTGAITCASGTAGYEAWITDSTVNTWGSTVLGSGANTIKMGCTGTNWVVIGSPAAGTGGGGGALPGQTGTDFQITLSTTSTANDTATIAPGNYFTYQQTNACTFKLTAGNHVGVADISFTPSGQIIFYWTQLGTNALSQTGTTTNCNPLGMSSPYFPGDGSHWIGQLVVTSSGAFDPTQIDQYPYSAGVPAVTASGGLQTTPSGSTINITPGASILQNNQANTAASGFTLDLALGTSTRPSIKGTYASVTGAITCNSGNTGYEAWITDYNNASPVWGANVASAGGGGSTTIKMGCDGTSFTVVGK